MISTAKLSYLRISPRKVRLVADLIRGEKVEKAQTVLNFTRKKAALPLLKLLRQAVANAKNKYLKIDEKNLYISKILVNEGTKNKRTFPRARGRADIIQKKSSHITIVLDEIEKKPEKKRLKAAARKRKKKLKEKAAEIEKKEGEERLRTEEPKAFKEKIKRRQEIKRARTKTGKGLRRFFRRKAF